MNLFCVFRAIVRKSRYQHKVHVSAAIDRRPLCGCRGRPPKAPIDRTFKYTAGPPTCSICLPIWEHEQCNMDLPLDL